MSLITWNNGNLTATVANGFESIFAIVGKSKGKWYWEITNTLGNNAMLGINDGRSNGWKQTNSLYIWKGNGNLYGDGLDNFSYSMPSFGDSDIIGIALNLDDGYIDFSKNGVFYGRINRDFLSHEQIFPVFSSGGSSVSITATANFGATEFNIVTSNSNNWEQLTREGYQPYDVENATWFKTTIVKHLIKSQNKIQVLVDDVWTDTLLSEPLSKADFETHGMDYISDIPFEKWDELDEEFEVIIWTDEEGGASKWLEIETDPFSAMQRLNQEEEFEVITWTDYKTELPSSRTSTEETVDEGKLFKATLEDFVAITGVEVN